MNEFKEGLVVSRKSSGEIIITEQLRNLLIELMKGNISKKEVMNLTGIGDKGTVEIKIQQLITEEPDLEILYAEYESRKNANFNGYNFRAEAIEMLRKDYSQSIMAEKIGVSRRTFATKIKKIVEQNTNNILGKLLVEHADRKMKRQQLSSLDLIKINVQLDEYEEQYPVGLTRYEKRNPTEVRLENILRVTQAVEEFIAEGHTIKELNEMGIISEGMYRKYREEAKNLPKILEGKNKGEK